MTKQVETKIFVLKTNTNLPIVFSLLLAQADQTQIEPIQTLKRKFASAFFLSPLKAQVVADGDTHMDIHQIIIDPERASLGRRQHFPDNLVSPW